MTERGAAATTYSSGVVAAASASGGGSDEDSLLDLIARIVTAQVSAPSGAVSSLVNVALADVGRHFGVDRAYVFEIDPRSATMDNTYEWCADGVTPERDNLQGLPLETFPWWVSELTAGRSIRLTSLDDLPSAATAERTILAAQSIQSLLVLGVRQHGALSGFVGFDNVRSPRAWTDTEVRVLEILIAAFAGGLERKALEDRLQLATQYDTLTNLANRTSLCAAVRQHLMHTVRPNPVTALCTLDLDDFDEINRRWGHDLGNEVLVEVGRRLCALLPTHDTVARLGGDEFAVLITDLADTAQAGAEVERLRDAIRKPLPLASGVSLSINASWGVRLVNGVENADADTLLRHADQALYRAKLTGPGHCHTYDPAVDRHARRQRDASQAVTEALANGEIEVFFQPIIDVPRSQPVAAEALVRWRHPTRGLLVPPLWLDEIMAESVMVDVGEFVLRESLRHVARWRESGPLRRVHVNVSARELLDPGFAERVASALDAVPHVPPAALTLEILESAALNDVPRAVAALEAVTERGVRVALDDFGTGYSSLTYLRQLPVSTLKVDRSFVASVATDGADLVIVDGVLRLGEAFDLSVVAEGVETPEQERILTGLGCRYAQGFGYARPMPAEALDVWLAQARCGAICADPAD